MFGIATYASGLIYAAHGGLAYLLMSAMGVAAIGFTLALGRMWNGKRLIAETGDAQITTI